MGAVRVAAVDLGASSGRVVLGEVGPGTLRLEPVARFGNDPVRSPDGLHWDVSGLYRNALDGLREAVRRPGPALRSIGIDSWAVDYGLVRGGRLLGEPFHYRDARGAAGAEVVHQRVPFDELYARNGLQYLPFNTLYQLAADSGIHDADRMLLVPDLLAWWLTGRMAAERTNASTTGLLDVHTQEWDDELIARLGIPRDLLADLVDPGDVLGTVLPGIATTLGLDPDAHDFPEVVAVGSHDTASAVVAVPMLTPDAAYISCGTWALVGVELAQPVVTDAAREANFTNEGGVDGRTRFLTNVMGLWLLNESVRAWGAADELGDLLRAAAAEPPPAATFDVQDPTFMPPDDMPDRITRWYVEAGLEPPRSRPAMVRAIVESLAQAFADAVDRAAALSGREVRAVHLVGGGALNDLLCQCVADRAGLPVLAGPVEATAIGNLLVQARTAGALHGDLEVLRALVAATHEPRRFPPRTAAARMGR